LLNYVGQIWATTTNTTTTVLWPFVRDYTGELVPEETFTHSPILIIIQLLSCLWYSHICAEKGH